MLRKDHTIRAPAQEPSRASDAPDIRSRGESRLSDNFQCWRRAEPRRVAAKRAARGNTRGNNR